MKMPDFSRKLPIGIQSFSKLRDMGFLYVDKTAYVYQLAHSGGNVYFLSRPRRFGKCLLLSTFDAYFRGQREFFHGLAIEKYEQEWTEYPVLRMDLNPGNYNYNYALNDMLDGYLRDWETIYGRDDADRTLSRRFYTVIRRAVEQTGHRVVVLVDEYDKPLLQAIGNDALLTEYRNTLKAFYGVLKSSDEYLRFVFLTGVTKFGQVSVFSDLNQLKDLTLDTDYATICGITREELTTVFTPELQRLAETQGMTWEETLEEMRRNYDGYHFAEDAPGVYNPFSTLNVLSSRNFSNYWFQTGTPTFLVELLKHSDYDLRHLEGEEMDAEAFADYRADADRPIPVIYQSGYLTIRSYDPQKKLYTLGFPNDEVKYGFLKFLVPYYTTLAPKDTAFNIGKFSDELKAGDTEAFLKRLRAFFADFPYELNDKTERHYQVVFYLVFKLLGQYVDAEVRSARGRADAVVKTPDFIYVFEFKLDGTAEEALQQIDDRAYLLPYSTDRRRLVKVGVEFDSAERNLGRWLCEERKLSVNDE